MTIAVARGSIAAHMASKEKTKDELSVQNLAILSGFAKNDLYISC